MCVGAAVHVPKSTQLLAASSDDRCTSLTSRLSAATWLERLFEHGSKSWVPPSMRIRMSHAYV
eukprot:4966544-Amphidinium_carterae.2